MFVKGNKLPRQGAGGGRANGLKGGRPTKEQAELKQRQIEITRLAGELAKKYLEDGLKPIMDVYKAAAAGTVVKVGKHRFKLKVDLATTRDAVGKFIAPAAKTLNLELIRGCEEFYREVMEEAGVDTSKRSDEAPDRDKLH
jgi:hypothetical protein